MRKIKISRISTSAKSRVYDISVKNNHNFFIKNKNEVLTHNCDFMTPNGQAALRGVMEQYHTSCRFLLTANYPSRIIPALHSRCQGFHIEKLDQVEFTARIAEICVTEGVELDLDTLDTYVKATYPDMRKCINLVQQNVVDSALTKPNRSDNTNSSDWMLAAVEQFKAGQYKQARTTIVSNARAEEYEDIYRFMYQNLELWGSTEQQKDAAILKIRQGLCNVPLCADPEINLAATMVELSMIAQGV